MQPLGELVRARADEPPSPPTERLSAGRQLNAIFARALSNVAQLSNYQETYIFRYPSARPNDSAHPANWAISNPLKANNFTQNDTTFQFSEMEASLCFFLLGT